MPLRNLFLTLAASTLLLVPDLGSAQEADMNTLIRVIEDNQTRIQRLERTVDDLRSQIRDLQNQLATRSTGTSEAPPDPIVGSWECTNNVFYYTIVFEQNGQVIQQEPTFGNARNSQWSRLNASEIAVAGQVVLQTEFHSENSLTVTDLRNKTKWECQRQ